MNLLKATLFLVASFHANVSAENAKGDQEPRHLRERIINGVNAEPGRYPYTVSFQDVQFSNFHFCGGSLIAPDIVLCAAHCAPTKPVDKYELVVNPHTLSNGNAERMKMGSFISHPNYNDRTLENDYMIIKLDGISENVPVKLNTNKQKPVDNSPLQVMGWGTTSNGGGSNTLQEVDVVTMTNAECKSDYVGYTIEDNMLCAFESFKGSCQGDSGGPLVIPKQSPTDEDIQVGIVSWGVGCAEPEHPGVYARVSEEFDWIKEHVCDLSVKAPAYFGCPGGPPDPTSAPVTQAPDPTSAPVTQAPDPTSAPVTQAPVPVSGGMTDIFVKIQLDASPGETSWLIRNASNKKVGGVPLEAYISESQYGTVSNIVSVPIDAAYRFILKDSWGDGLQGQVFVYLGNSADPDKILGYYAGGEDSVETFSKKRIDFVAGTSGITGGPPPLPAGFMAVVVSVTLDSFPEETSWKIKDLATNSVVDGALVKDGFYANEFPGETVEDTIYLAEGGRYKFILKDSHGDGLDGHITLYSGVAGGTVLGRYNSDATSFTAKHTFKFST